MGRESYSREMSCEGVFFFCGESLWGRVRDREDKIRGRFVIWMGERRVWRMYCFLFGSMDLRRFPNNFFCFFLCAGQFLAPSREARATDEQQESCWTGQETGGWIWWLKCMLVNCLPYLWHCPWREIIVGMLVSLILLACSLH